MQTKTFFSINHNFSFHNVMYLKNPDISENNATEVFREYIFALDLFKHLVVIENSISHKMIVLTCESKNTNILVEYLNRLKFCQATKIKENQLDKIFITIKNFDDLITFLNEQAIFPLYLLTQSIPTVQNGYIQLHIPHYMDPNSITKIIESSNAVNIRICKGNHTMPLYTGGTQEVSDPILSDNLNNLIASSASIENKKQIILHFSPWAIEQLNEIRVTHSGHNIAIEINNVLYSIFNLKETKSIPKDILLVECKTEKEARKLLQTLNIGYLSRIKVDHVDYNVPSPYENYFKYLFLLQLMLIVLFLTINRKKKILISLFLSSLFFLYFTHVINNQITYMDLMINSGLIGLFIVMSIIKDLVIGSYLIFFSFFTSIILMGISNILKLSSLHLVSSSASLATLNILTVHHIILILFSKSTSEETYQEK